MAKIYISGPMTGIPEYNRPEFNRHATKLRNEGHSVFNPAECKIPDGKPETWENYMREDIRMLSECDTIALLPGWEKSRGASIELFIATTIGLSVIHL